MDLTTIGMQPLSIVPNTGKSSQDVRSGGGSSSAGSMFICQSSLQMDTITVTTSTAGNDGGFLYFEHSETLIIKNFECKSCRAGNNGGETYLEIENSDKLEFTNYVSNNAQAGVNGAIVYGCDFDSTNKKLAIDTMAITNILGVCALKYVGIIKRIQVLKMKIYHEN